MARSQVRFVEVKREREREGESKGDSDMKSRTNSIHDWSQSLGNTIHHEGYLAVSPTVGNVARCALRVVRI